MRITIWCRPHRDHKSTDAVKWFVSKSKEYAGDLALDPQEGMYLVFNEEEAQRIRMIVFKVLGRKPKPHELSVHSWNCKLHGRHPNFIVIDNCELIPAAKMALMILPMMAAETKEVLLTCSKYNNFAVRLMTGIQEDIVKVKHAIDVLQKMLEVNTK